MVHSPSTEPPVHAAAASTRLIETSVELVRAEVAVALARARQAVIRAFAALLATILAAALLQVALVVGILSPLLVRTLPSESVWMAIALPALLALASSFAAVWAWLSMRRSLEKKSLEKKSVEPSITASDGIQPAATQSPADTQSTGPVFASLQEERGRQ